MTRDLATQMADTFRRAGKKSVSIGQQKSSGAWYVQVGSQRLWSPNHGSRALRRIVEHLLPIMHRDMLEGRGGR